MHPNRALYSEADQNYLLNRTQESNANSKQNHQKLNSTKICEFQELKIGINVSLDSSLKFNYLLEMQIHIIYSGVNQE